MMDASLRLGTTAQRLCCANGTQQHHCGIVASPGSLRSLKRPLRPRTHLEHSRSTFRCEAGNGQHAEPQHSQHQQKHTSRGNGRHTDRYDLVHAAAALDKQSCSPRHTIINATMDVPLCRHDALPLSLYNPYENLPCDGKTRSEAEEACDPTKRDCQTAMHVWETNCKNCHGTGTVASYASRGGRGGRGARRLLYTCPSCHGVGCVRHTSTRILPDVHGGNGQYTAGRPPCEITWADDSGKKKSLFERFKEKLGS